MRGSFARSSSGTSAIEFALVAPVLIFLAIGLIDVGRYMYFGIVVTHAARAGVQYGAQNIISADDATGMSSAALRDAPNITISVAPSYFCSPNGTAASAVACGSGVPYYVQVKASGTFQALFSYPGIPNHIPIAATAVMRVANQ